jgi:hypothetical protein
MISRAAKSGTLDFSIPRIPLWYDPSGLRNYNVASEVTASATTQSGLSLGIYFDVPTYTIDLTSPEEFPVPFGPVLASNKIPIALLPKMFSYSSLFTVTMGILLGLLNPFKYFRR